VMSGGTQGAGKEKRNLTKSVGGPSFHGGELARAGSSRSPRGLGTRKTDNYIARIGKGEKSHRTN